MLILLSLSSLFFTFPFTTLTACLETIDSWMSPVSICIPLSRTSYSPHLDVLHSFPTPYTTTPINVAPSFPSPSLSSLDTISSPCQSSSHTIFHSLPPSFSSSPLHNIHLMVTRAKYHIHKPIQKLFATPEFLEPTSVIQALKFLIWH